MRAPDQPPDSSCSGVTAMWCWSWASAMTRWYSGGRALKPAASSDITGDSRITPKGMSNVGPARLGEFYRWLSNAERQQLQKAFSVHFQYDLRVGRVTRQAVPIHHGLAAGEAARQFDLHVARFGLPNNLGFERHRHGQRVGN